MEKIFLSNSVNDDDIKKCMCVCDPAGLFETNKYIDGIHFDKEVTKDNRVFIKLTYGTRFSQSHGEKYNRRLVRVLTDKKSGLRYIKKELLLKTFNFFTTTYSESIATRKHIQKNTNLRNFLIESISKNARISVDKISSHLYSVATHTDTGEFREASIFIRIHNKESLLSIFKILTDNGIEL